MPLTRTQPSWLLFPRSTRLALRVSSKRTPLAARSAVWQSVLTRTLDRSLIDEQNPCTGTPVRGFLFFIFRDGKVSLRAFGAGVERGYAGLSSLLRAKREPEMVLAPVRGAERFFIKANCSLLRAKREPEKHQRFRRAGSTRKGLLAPFRPRRGCRNGKKLVASLNAFFSFLRFAALQLVLPLC